MYHVSVLFRAEREYEFAVHPDELAGLDPDAAAAWLQDEFDALDCPPANPLGKRLILDMILAVARHAGEQRFAQGGEWPRHFAACVGLTLERPSVRIDVPGCVVT